MDQERLYANECHAKCAGLEVEGQDFADCDGLNIVIPGKTKLPPNRLPQKQLQELEDKEQEEVME